MVFGPERMTRLHLEKARLRGELVDLSEVACQVGLTCRCEASDPLYRSLLWQYPSACERDTVVVGDLLRDLQSQMAVSDRKHKMFYYVLPPLRTWWMAPRYFLKLMVLYQGDSIESVTILMEQESPEQLFAGLSPWLPASLLVRLLQSIRRLGTLCYRSELHLIRSLDATAKELLGRNPLQVEIQGHLDQWRPAFVPQEFTREEYREVVLRSLLKDLELTAAVAHQMQADIRFSVSGVLELMAHYVGIVPGNEEGSFIRDEVQFH